MVSPIIAGLFQGAGKGLQDYAKYGFEEQQTEKRMSHDEHMTKIKADLDLQRDKIMNELRQKGAETIKGMEIASSEKIAAASQALTKQQLEENARHHKELESFNRQKLELDSEIKNLMLDEKRDKAELMRYQAQAGQLQREVEGVVKQMGETRDPKERAGLALRKAEYEARMDEVQAQALKSNVKSSRREDLNRFNDLLGKFAAYGNTEVGKKIGNYPVSEADVREFNALSSKLGLGKDSKIEAKKGWFGTDTSGGKGKVVLDTKGKELVDSLIAMAGGAQAGETSTNGSGRAAQQPAAPAESMPSPETGVQKLSPGAGGLIGSTMANPPTDLSAMSDEEIERMASGRGATSAVRAEAERRRNARWQKALSTGMPPA